MHSTKTIVVTSQQIESTLAKTAAYLGKDYCLRTDENGTLSVIKTPDAPAGTFPIFFYANVASQLERAANKLIQYGLTKGKEEDIAAAIIEKKELLMIRVHGSTVIKIEDSNCAKRIDQMKKYGFSI